MKRIASVTIALALLISALMSVMPASYASFDDISGHWAYDTIEVMVAEGILSGYGDGTFRPDNTVTRAEFIKMMAAAFRLESGEDGHFVPYTDVSSVDWFYPYISAAFNDGFLIDYGIAFEPSTELTREESVTLLARFLNFPAGNIVPLGTFADYELINTEYRPYVLRAAYADLIWGYPDGTLRPDATLTRAEALTLLKRAMGMKRHERIEIVSYSTDADGNIRILDQTEPIIGLNTTGDIYIPVSLGGMSVRFEDCTLSGTVYVSSDVMVEFDSCSIGRLVVDVDSVRMSAISLRGGSYLERAEFYTTGGIYCTEGCGVGEMYVGENAPRTMFSGDGTLGSAEIYADDFSTSYKPSSVKLARGLKAAVAGTLYNEYSIAQLHEEQKETVDDTGFLVQPYVEKVDGVDCISFIPARDGRVYHATSNAPNNAIGYTMSNGNIYRTVQAGVKASIIIDRNLNFNLIKYYIFEFADDSGVLYRSVSVPVSKPLQDFSANGFSGTLQLTSFMGFDSLSFVPSFEGQLIWFYTDTSVIMSRDYFKREADNMLAWGGIDPAKYPHVQPGIPVTVQLAMTVSSRSNVAVALRLPNGEYTEPVTVTRNGSVGGDAYSYVSPPVPNAPSGFKDVPIARWNGVTDSVSFIPKYNGTVKIEYYADSSLASQPYYTYDSIVHESVNFSLTMTPTAAAVMYPTVMITLIDKSGVVYGPYNVTRYNPDGSVIIKPEVQP